ncbi:hypothetical protein [Fluviicola taffensis]|uniref:Uncharacterized protein n=1 Tax=Fluviicola taffensis (strain DSM 16823 / NCIMB 13979 / RW262) TaxID=755732 RepID=F2IET8_FLUTR|nr:hypothetical protein [Fluviicola taffensis]AEA45655.1 hypothetical protein Fluta_3687 [Fluviicola taffensis DSM 16823]
MASELKIFSIYKIQNEDKYYLLRTERPSFSNSSQTQENLADKIEQNKREYILDQIGTSDNKNSKKNFDFIGEFQGCPIGDKLYLDNGNLELNIYYLETEFGQPWVIIGNANSETEFLTELSDDEDLLGLKPIGQPKQIKATFVTENDFDLSEIEN